MASPLFRAAATPRGLSPARDRPRPLVAEQGGLKESHGPPPGYAFTAREILQGLENDEFEPFFQPKIHLRTLRVVGAEALARWRHPLLGIVGPQAFVEILDEAGKLDRLSHCMLTKAARFGRSLDQAGFSGTMAVHLSLTSLADGPLAQELMAGTRSPHLDPRQVVLAISPGSAPVERAKAIDNLALLRKEGFALSIDAGAPGYAALQCLAVLPFSEIKIDRSQIASAVRFEATKTMLGSSIHRARGLGIQSVAARIETRVQWHLLAELRCDIAQGYCIAKPMSAAAYLDWLGAWPRRQRH